MTNRFLQITAGVFLVFIWLTCEVSFAGEGNQVVSVEVVRPEKRTMEQYIEITGHFNSNEKSTFGARVQGPLINLMSDEGDRVKKGMVMGIVDPTDYDLSLILSKLNVETAKTGVIRAETEVQRSKTHLETMKADLDRIKGVFDKGSFPKQRLDHAYNAYESAVAVYTQAKIALNDARTQVHVLKTMVKVAEKKRADCRITAPFDGVVTKRHASIGEWMIPGKSVFTLESDNPIEVKGHISEIYLEKLSLKMPVSVTVDGISEPCTDSAHDCKAVLSEIAPVADSKQGTVEITVKIANENFKLKPGLYARMRVIFNRSLDALAIPKSCLFQKQGKSYVFVINDDKTHLREIKTGITQGEMIQVISGLDENSRVVTTDLSRLQDGAIVRIQN